MQDIAAQPQLTPRYRPPVGVPARGEERRRPAAAVSVAVHLLLGLLVVAPFAAAGVVAPMGQGAGGPGPAGGGGGGRGGTGGVRRPANERLRYIQVAPEPPVARPSAVTPAPQRVEPPTPVEMPRPVPPPQPEAKPDTTPTVATATADVAAASGSGGGTGADGTAGNGPGSGGGAGTGVGTGRGSGVGPGTGGGVQQNHPPLPIEMFLPPMPVPDRLRGFRLVAEFDVDETGRILSLTFTETRDGAYNRRLRDVLRSIRFRPGSRPDGTPVRMKAQIEYIL